MGSEASARRCLADIWREDLQNTIKGTNIPKAYIDEMENYYDFLQQTNTPNKLTTFMLRYNCKMILGEKEYYATRKGQKDLEALSRVIELVTAHIIVTHPKDVDLFQERLLDYQQCILNKRLKYIDSEYTVADQLYVRLLTSLD